jgi:hypothetical protein
MKKSTVAFLISAACAVAQVLSGAAWSATDRGARDSERGQGRSESRQQLDTRYQHNRYYPPRGHAVPTLPRGVVIQRGGSRYWYSSGIWYRPYGSRYLVVRPPFGVFVPVLPPFYSTIWWSGVPYYYANDTYYVWRDNTHGYEVVRPPAERNVSTSAPATDEVFIYPKAGQSEEQSNKDRYECHRWAADQTGYDATQASGSIGTERAGGDRAGYMRALTACLEGRGYSVR